MRGIHLKSLSSAQYGLVMILEKPNQAWSNEKPADNAIRLIPFASLPEPRYKLRMKTPGGLQRPQLSQFRKFFVTSHFCAWFSA